MRTIARVCRAIPSQLRHVSTIGKKCQTAICPPQSICLHNIVNFGLLTTEIDWCMSLGHPSRFQRASRLGFVTAPTLLSGGQPNFSQCLAVSWAGALYIHFGGCCPVTEFCQLQNSLCEEVLRSPILAALLHGTRAVGVSQTLRRCIFARVRPSRSTLGVRTVSGFS